MELQLRVKSQCNGYGEKPFVVLYSCSRHTHIHTYIYIYPLLWNNEHYRLFGTTAHGQSKERCEIEKY